VSAFIARHQSNADARGLSRWTHATPTTAESSRARDHGVDKVSLFSVFADQEQNLDPPVRGRTTPVSAGQRLSAATTGKKKAA
jgi:hypothetical protein